MRTNRIKCDGEGIYHLISRIVGRDFKLNDDEKDIFVRIMRKAERFSGINILTFAVMSNHFHILVHIPDVKNDQISNAELIERYRALYGDTRANLLAGKWEKLGTDPERKLVLETEREKLLSRMHDVSEFMKTLKSRYTISYNRRHNREGTLWSERFKSVLFEKGSTAMLTVARYIDLNAVRAGIVVNPKDYRWCGYSEACHSTKRALSGITMVENCMNPNKPLSVKEALEAYGSLLYTEGQTLRKGYTKEEVAEMIRHEGTLLDFALVRCRIRYFELGLVIGGKEFVETVCDRALLPRKHVHILANTKCGDFWIARKCNHHEVIDIYEEAGV